MLKLKKYIGGMIHTVIYVIIMDYCCFYNDGYIYSWRKYMTSSCRPYRILHILLDETNPKSIINTLRPWTHWRLFCGRYFQMNFVWWNFLIHYHILIHYFTDTNFTDNNHVANVIGQRLTCQANEAVILLWRHNGQSSVSNHQPYDCLHNRLFRRWSK